MILFANSDNALADVVSHLDPPQRISCTFQSLCYILFILDLAASYQRRYNTIEFLLVLRPEVGFDESGDGKGVGVQIG